jgi:hypothetical protein
MPKPRLLYCATDKELFDVLMSSKQHFGERILLRLARRRGILYSRSDDRADLADKLSVMTYGFHEIRAIQDEFERAGRGEKTTSFRINMELTATEIKEIADEYRDSADDEEKVVTRNVGQGGVAVDLKYTETDFSKTRLRQRQEREAHIEFKVEQGHTVVTLPATEKARQTVTALKDRLYAKKQADIGVEEVDLSSVTDPKLRTAFFTRLITGLAGFALQNVTRVKADLAEKPEDALDDEENGEGDGTEEASEEMLGVVRAVALNGESLLASPLYQGLQRRGFFLTSITWRSKRNALPFQIVEFDAAFDDPGNRREFKYAVRGWATQKGGDYIKNFKAVPAEDKKVLLGLIEDAAMTVQRQIKAEFAAQAGARTSDQEVPNEPRPVV